MTHEPAQLTREGDVIAATFPRLIAYPPQLVWRALIDSALLPQWLAAGHVEPRVGGAVRLDFADSGTVIDSEVTALQEGRLVEYSWSQPGEPMRLVRWRIEPHAGGARLMLTAKTPAGEDAGRTCAGWEAHLEMLAAALDGAPIAFPFETFKAAREAYRVKVAALG